MPKTVSKKADGLARAIISVYEQSGSSRSTKEVLIRQKLEVLKLCAYAMEDEWQLPPLPDPLNIEAYRVILTYEGTNRFMRDLRRHLEAHGFLTVRQIEAVMGPVTPQDMDELLRHGLQVPVYAWQAREIVLALHREAAARARELVKESEDKT